MAFRLVRYLNGSGAPTAAPKANSAILLTNSESSTAGQVMKFSSGRLTAAATNSGAAVCIALETVTGATDAKTRIEWLIPAVAVYEATCTGSESGSFKVGINARLDADGTDIDWSDANNDGPFMVMEIDTTNSLVRGVFRKTGLNT